MPEESPIRLLLSGLLAFGPGKAELLERIRSTGSLSAAAGEMGMSYMKAWKMVRGLNERFREPLVALSRGGDQRGGASLTPEGERLLALYREAVTAAEQATASVLASMRELLNPDELDSAH
jgi:molybdate transport system regulatory protein